LNILIPEGCSVISLDTETCRMGGGELAPALVCVSIAAQDENYEIVADIRKHDDPDLEGWLATVLRGDHTHIITARGSYDMLVLCTAFPTLWPLVWQAYEDGRIHDVQIIEKLKCLSTTGSLEFAQLPDGSTMKLRFSLTELEQKYLGLNRSADKKKTVDADGNDVSPWRERYGELRDVPLESWPAEAVEYPLDDARNTLAVFEAMVKDLRESGPCSAATEAFQAACDFALWICTSWGMETDPERVALLETALEAELNPTKMAPLYEAGILRPAEPPRPYKNQPTKFTAGTEESVNKKVLQAHVERICQQHKIPTKMTAGGEKGVPQISTDADVLSRLAPLDPLLTIYQGRQELIKLKTTYLPVLQHGLVHFAFDVLKETGRTSSHGSDIFPSTNGQNQPTIGGDMSVRECFVPRAGHLLCSVDYSMLELCAVAQTTFDLFKKSVHLEKINAGYDLHAYLGAQLAADLDPDFGHVIDEARGLGDRLTPDEIYQIFIRAKNDPDEDVRKLYQHYRKFAKPTGLGYPGGLGAQTFIEFARTVYGVEVTLEQAERFKEIWFATYPEMRQYFDWLGGQCDRQNAGTYAYSTPFGMYRAATTFCAGANGKAMQSPAAECAKTSLFLVVRSCYDVNLKSPLYGCHPVDFIHDEILVELPDDVYAHDRAFEVSRLMVSAGSLVFPDVKMKAEPALMRRWYKEAEPVYDPLTRRLIPWEPKAKGGGEKKAG